jgi:hypothetical protein
MKMWKGNWNSTTLLFYLKGLEILHQEKRGQVKNIIMEYLNGILYHKSGPANKQHTTRFIIFALDRIVSYQYSIQMHCILL